MEHTNQFDGRLEKWELNTTIYGDHFITAIIYEDSKKRFVDGQVIHTSLVRKIDFENALVYTLNSTYKLGEEYDKPVELTLELVT